MSRSRKSSPFQGGEDVNEPENPTPVVGVTDARPLALADLIGQRRGAESLRHVLPTETNGGSGRVAACAFGSSI